MQHLQGITKTWSLWSQPGQALKLDLAGVYTRVVPFLQKAKFLASASYCSDYRNN